MKTAQEICKKLNEIVRPIHAHSDQLTAIAYWVESEFNNFNKSVSDADKANAYIQQDRDIRAAINADENESTFDEVVRLQAKLEHLKEELKAERVMSATHNAAIQVARGAWAQLADACGESGLLPEDAVYQMLLQAEAMYKNRIKEPNLFINQDPDREAPGHQNGKK